MPNKYLKKLREPEIIISIITLTLFLIIFFIMGWFFVKKSDPTDNNFPPAEELMSEEKTYTFLNGKGEVVIEGTTKQLFGVIFKNNVEIVKKLRQIEAQLSKVGSASNTKK